MAANITSVLGITSTGIFAAAYAAVYDAIYDAAYAAVGNTPT